MYIYIYCFKCVIRFALLKLSFLHWFGLNCRKFSTIGACQVAIHRLENFRSSPVKVAESVSGACSESGVVEEDRIGMLGRLGTTASMGEKVLWEMAGRLSPCI